MLRRIITILLAIAATTGLKAQSVRQARMWVDSDYARHTTVKATGETVSGQIDVSDAAPGVHVLHIQAEDDSDVRGQLQSYFFVLTDSVAAAYECWLDNDYAHKTAGANTGQELNAILPIDNLTVGIHYLHTRTCDRFGRWSVPTRNIFFLEDSVASAYEYWIDDDYANRKRGEGDDTQVTISEDISQIGGGLHYFNFRAFDRYGGPTLAQRYVFMVVDSVVSHYEYWLDDDMSSLQTVEGNGQDIALTMDISHLDCGIHFLNFRCRNSFGEASTLQRWLVYVPDDDPVAHRPIVSYDYTLNDQTQTVSIEPTLEYEMQAQAFALPDPADVGSLTEGCRWTWDHTQQTLRLDRETPQSFNIMFRNKAGRLSGSVGKDFTLADSITKPIRQLQLGHAVSYTKVRGGEFEVVSFHTDKDGDYYLMSTQSCELHLLRGETLQYVIPSDSMLRGHRVALEAGVTYHGIVCHTVTDAANPRSTIDVMLKENIDKVLTPVISYENETVTITCQQEGVDIYYTLDGTTPTTESTRYEGPFRQVLNCTVTAVAVAEGLDYSDLATYVIGAYKTEKPVIAINGWEVSMTCATEESTIHYTLDGQTPTATDSVYSKPLTLTRNGVVKAVAMRNGYFDSDVDSLVVNWLQVETPLMAFADSVLTISCPREGVTLHYEIGHDRTPTAESPVYDEPLTLERNLPVTVFGMADGLLDSETVTFLPDTFTCKPTAIAYDGRWLRMSTTTREADIHYTLDGTQPTETSPTYTEPLEVRSLLTLRTLVTKDDVINSETKSFDVDYLYDGRLALLRKPQLLSRAFEWCGEEAVKTLVVDGPVGNDDWLTMRRLPALHTLNLEPAQPESQHMPDSALAGARMVWCTTPGMLSSMGHDILADCPLLAAVTWTSTTVQMAEDALGQHANPNLLLYVKGETLAPVRAVRNVVSNLVARSIVLTDTVAPNNFYCPTTFTAINISYTHNYRQKTRQGVCQGWETLALPFKVQTVTHWKNGELVPFAARQTGDTRKPFWVARLEANGFAATDGIEANTPYIVSMPNDSALYADRNLLAGDVTFAARNTTVGVTDTETNMGTMGDIAFVPNYSRRLPSADDYAVNLYEAYDALHPEGSIFLPNYRELRPFEAYTTLTALMSSQPGTTEYSAPRPRYIAIDMAEGDVSGILELAADDSWANGVRVYDLSGTLVVQGERKEVMKRLPKGIYLVCPAGERLQGKNGRKVVVK